MYDRKTRREAEKQQPRLVYGMMLHLLSKSSLFSSSGLHKFFQIFCTQVRMKTMFAIGFCFTALMGMFNSMWAVWSVQNTRIPPNEQLLMTVCFCSALMEEWWPSSHSSRSHTSRDCRIVTCWEKTTLTVPLFSSTSSAQCPSDRYLLLDVTLFLWHITTFLCGPVIQPT